MNTHSGKAGMKFGNWTPEGVLSLQEELAIANTKLAGANRENAVLRESVARLCSEASATNGIELEIANLRAENARLQAILEKLCADNSALYEALKKIDKCAISQEADDIVCAVLKKTT